jgi:hypothetical protein
VAPRAEDPAPASGGPAIAFGGVKWDAGKVPLHLLPTRPLEALARVLGFGAYKKAKPGGSPGYGANNWRSGIAYSRLYAAALRHCWLWWRGETLDPDSGQHHLAHALAELAFILEYELGPEDRRVVCDDRAGNDAP